MTELQTKALETARSAIIHEVESRYNERRLIQDKVFNSLQETFPTLMKAANPEILVLEGEDFKFANWENGALCGRISDSEMIYIRDIESYGRYLYRKQEILEEKINSILASLNSYERLLLKQEIEIRERFPNLDSQK